MLSIISKPAGMTTNSIQQMARTKETQDTANPKKAETKQTTTKKAEDKKSASPDISADDFLRAAASVLKICYFDGMYSMPIEMVLAVIPDDLSDIDPEKMQDLFTHLVNLTKSYVKAQNNQNETIVGILEPFFPED